MSVRADFMHLSVQQGIKCTNYEVLKVVLERKEKKGMVGGIAPHCCFSLMR